MIKNDNITIILTRYEVSFLVKCLAYTVDRLHANKAALVFENEMYECENSKEIAEHNEMILDCEKLGNELKKVL